MRPFALALLVLGAVPVFGQSLTARLEMLAPDAPEGRWDLKHSPLAQAAALRRVLSDGRTEVWPLEALAMEDGVTLSGASLQAGEPIKMSAPPLPAAFSDYSALMTLGSQSFPVAAAQRAAALNQDRSSLTMAELGREGPLALLLAARLCGDTYRRLVDGTDAAASFFREIGVARPGGIEVLDSPSALVNSMRDLIPGDADAVRMLAVSTRPAQGWRIADVDEAQAVIVELGDQLSIIAYRGSATPDDWRSNFNAVLEAPIWGGGKGRVFRGYHGAHRKMQFLTRYVMSRRGTVVIAGHSRGGALAKLLAMHLSRLPVSARVRLAAFGAPPAGEDSLYDLLPSGSVLLANQDDPVPMLVEAARLIPFSTAMRYERNLVMDNRARRSVESLLKLPAQPVGGLAGQGASQGLWQTAQSLQRNLWSIRQLGESEHLLPEYRRRLLDRAWERAILTRQGSEVLSLAAHGDALLAP